MFHTQYTPTVPYRTIHEKTLLFRFTNVLWPAAAVTYNSPASTHKDIVKLKYLSICIVVD